MVSRKVATAYLRMWDYFVLFLLPLLLRFLFWNQSLLQNQFRRTPPVPRRGDSVPEGHGGTCMAYIVEVSRGADGLKYSLPVRFSRFERLHTELMSELPHLSSQLPPLPAKRGPLNPTKLSSFFSTLLKPPAAGPAPGTSPPAAAPPPAPPAADPLAIEERTRGLDAYLRALVQLPGVAASAALQDLVALSTPAESAVRQALEAAASHDEARLSALSDLSRELAVSSAYVRTARAARERVDARSAVLMRALDSTSAMLARWRDRVHVGRALRQWHAVCQVAVARRQQKRIEQAAAALSAEQTRAEQLQGERAHLDARLAEAAELLRAADAREAALRTSHFTELDELQRALATHDVAARETAAAWGGRDQHNCRGSQRG